MNEKQDPTKGATERIFVVTVDNEPGVLARVSGLITGRGWNIYSLTVHVFDDRPTVAVMTFKFMATTELSEQVVNQIGKLVPVHSVEDLTGNPRRIEVRLVLVKVVIGRNPADLPRTVIARAEKQGGVLFSRGLKGALFFVRTGSEDECRSFIADMRQFGTVSTNGSGTVALA